MAALLTRPRPGEDFLSGLSPAAAAFRHEFGLSVTPPPPEAAGTVHVAVGKSVEKTVALLQWTIRMFPGWEICLLHVQRPSPLIPTLLGKLPASRANPEMVTAFRKEEKAEIMKLLSTYLITCSKSRVKASIITTEANEVQKGIVNLVNLHMIRKLVVGTIPDFMKGKRSSCKACHAAKYAPSYCEMWFVNKGKLIWTRQASANSSIDLSSRHLATSSARNLISWSLNSCQNEAEASQVDLTLSTISQYVESTCDSLYSHSASSSRSLSSGSGHATSVKPRVSSIGSAKTMEECLCIQLSELKVKADQSKDETCLKLLEQRQLEAEAREILNKVKALEMAYSHGTEQRIDAEDALRITMQEEEKLLEERERITQQLQKTLRNIALLDNRAQEANRRCEEVAGELKLIQASVATLREEKQKLQRQKIEATRWLDRRRSHEQCGNANESKFNRFRGEVAELPEFLLSDLEAATCNFSESFMIGKGGYGIVYKGEMLDKTVQVLGKLHHPHLVELIGVCQESWLLVYEYLPGGSLQNYLFNNNNISSLNWKTRAQILADIARGLLFLHSFGPKKIVHGNLKPENLLLDSGNRCKISDYADHMLTANQTFRCPSFRRCAGSIGVSLYTDPESHRTGAVSYKSDIYSFGVVILQLVTGKTHGGLVGEVKRALCIGKVASILDVSAGEWSGYVARRLVDLGLQCCELNGRERPELTPALVKELEHMPFLEEQTVPSFFLCPILREIMHDPQVAADGFTYEGEALRGWLENGHETSPMTNLKLGNLNLTPNHSLKLAIQDWVANLNITS
ncbi:U-box domain-containing protein 33 [Sesamum alatum]|uniref:RING-type E3 ubiquitin transferase n=1 Tax=Sesamum alatum TaxID=300844 RepID=A0AAE2D027_9LAMI|nr:U-box domain-containing protein 33 [Sesamum alatum]